MQTTMTTTQATETTTPDPRAAWNAVERLANEGHRDLARDLMAVLQMPAVRDALASMASETATGGGMLLAEQAAEASLYT